MLLRSPFALSTQISQDEIMRSSDFSRQWTLWAEGKFGDTTLVYNKTAEKDYADLLACVGLTPETLRTRKVLEIGYGHGRILHSIQCDCPFAVGVDLVLPYPSSNVERGMIVRADLMTSPFRPRQFDLVICRGVIHHTESAAEGFRHVAEEVASGGKLYLYVYNAGALVIWLRRLLPFSWMLPEIIRLWLARIVGGILAIFPVGQLARRREAFRLMYGNYTLTAFDVISPRYMSHHSVEEVMSWFKQAGFEARQTAPGLYVGGFKGQVA